MSYVSLDKEGGVTKKIVKEGDPTNTPSNGQQVSVHYVGYLDETGEEFDTSKLFGDSDYSRPLAFRIGGGSVVQGFDIAVRSMCLGEKCQVKIKSHLAYGSDGAPAKGMMPEIPPDSDLTFDLELVSIGVDESKAKADRDRLEIARAERAAAEAERAAIAKEKEAAKAKRQEELDAKKEKKSGGKKGKGSKSAPKASADDELDSKAIKKMKPKELKAHLKARGASVIGNKKELCARLLELAL